MFVYGLEMHSSSKSAGQIARGLNRYGYSIASLGDLPKQLFIVGCILNVRPSCNARRAMAYVKTIGSRPYIALVCILPRIWDAPFVVHV
jgi:hypothetical protein